MTAATAAVTGAALAVRERSPQNRPQVRPVAGPTDISMSFAPINSTSPNPVGSVSFSRSPELDLSGSTRTASYFSYELRVQGESNQTCKSEWKVLTASGGDRIKGAAVGVFIAETEETSTRYISFLNPDPRFGRWFVKLAFSCPDGARAETRSPVHS
ncbi:hypothetical protein GCM10010468_59320 [Actinocorallia longicatena]|uniref:Uncharacterized protein n=1 Tax=Actinocorallia longicatena TaxID=111803 RepID=A0ABP6QHF6_9ACTN